jgi:hypothetical protein
MQRYTIYLSCEMLYMFQAVPPSIIRSSKLYIQHRRYISKYNQHDATLHNLFISVKCSTCFRWYLRPSLGDQKCIYSIGYLSEFYYCLPLSWKSWNSSTIAAGSSKIMTSTRCCIYSFELLMMGGGTA